MAMEISAVAERRLWPRALLTPFTDSVQLTSADERAYTAYAGSESHKGFEVVEVGFDGDPTRTAASRPSRPSARRPEPRHLPRSRLAARGRLAQLVRAPALQAGGRRFDPGTAHS